jgi:hypothetical protein
MIEVDCLLATRENCVVRRGRSLFSDFMFEFEFEFERYEYDNVR